MCPEHETFWTLLRDSAHWEFELFLMLLVDFVLLGVAWPFVKRHYLRYCHARIVAGEQNTSNTHLDRRHPNG